MTTKPKTRESPASGINPKLIALAVALDKAKAELNRAGEAEEDEVPAIRVILDLADKFSEIAATNLNELCLKARYVDREIGFPDTTCIEESIIRDLLGFFEGRASA